MKRQLCLERKAAIDRLKKLKDKLAADLMKMECGRIYLNSSKDEIVQTSLDISNLICLLDQCKHISKVCFHSLATDSDKLKTTIRKGVVTIHLYFPNGATDSWEYFINCK